MRVTIDLKGLNRHVEKITALTDKNRTTRILAFDSVALISSRVQQEGKNSQGQRFGNYSNQYSKTRQKKGLQTGYIDLTFTGETIRYFLPFVYKNDWAVGFITKRSADIAEFNERRYGSIFILSANEREIIISSFKKIISEILR
jgi:hypothetical protein